MNLEKRNYTKKTVQKLVVNDILLTRPEDILKAQQCFYQSLYTKEKNNSSRTELSNLLNGLQIPSLDEHLMQSCEGEITENECSDVLKSFQNGKSPGNDGIPSEFYKLFWPQLKSLLVEVYNESSNNEVAALSNSSCYYINREKRFRQVPSKKLASNLSPQCGL